MDWKTIATVTATLIVAAAAYANALRTRARGTLPARSL
jgi:hypothetical protein